MRVIEDADLQPFNTFRVRARALYLAILEQPEDVTRLRDEPRFRGLQRLILGGGSNILFRGDFHGVVVCVGIRGMSFEAVDGDTVRVRCAGGENWHKLVCQTIDLGWCGLENLSLIPGTVGAAPMQNIGAYGVEISSRFEYLEAFDLDYGTLDRFDRDACAFGYRTSQFKRTPPDRYLIHLVALRLSRTLQPVLHYSGIREELQKDNGGQLTARRISSAICRLRKRKLPDPQRIGNAGSFFKNPVVRGEIASDLAERFPEMPAHPEPDGSTKLSAGWLIDQCGWKGHRQGDAGVSGRHALVLVNHGAATGAELWQLAQSIRDSVEHRFHVRLEPEPRIV